MLKKIININPILSCLIMAITGYLFIVEPYRNPALTISNDPNIKNVQLAITEKYNISIMNLNPTPLSIEHYGHHRRYGQHIIDIKVIDSNQSVIFEASPNDVFVITDIKGFKLGLVKVNFK